MNEEITAFGCKVVAQYAILGPYDFVTLIDPPDNETVAHLSVDLGSHGTVNILTLPAIEIGDFGGNSSAGNNSATSSPDRFTGHGMT